MYKFNLGDKVYAKDKRVRGIKTDGRVFWVIKTNGRTFDAVINLNGNERLLRQLNYEDFFFVPVKKMYKDYICRQDFCENICLCNSSECDKSKCTIWQTPSADVAEILMCKDCKWHTTFENIDKSSIEYWCDLHDCDIKSNDFCSFGKQK